ncbi:type VI secretion system baseplate subunit TssK [Sphingomonas sp.]|uniref:type VI secretion system baseplate subunit TssK n=1 Tax=Sphingomonas sp. TaxID=28214 RepID=UPI0028AA78AC|nr:type VI secretion system baseplate subunit TssK [Sphingomonas sp.]
MPIHAKDIPDLVHWYRGMLLMPEHFRDAAARGEMLFPYLLQAAQPLAWGVRAMTSGMHGSVFVLDAIEAIFPDGAVAAFDRARGAEPLQYDTDSGDHGMEHGKPVDLYLTIAGWTPASLDLDRTDTGTPSRYAAYPRAPQPAPPVADDDIELAERIWLRPVFSLVAGTRDRPPRAAYAALRIARLGLRDGKPAVLEYEPPRLRIGEASVLPGRINGLIDDMQARAAQIREDASVPRAVVTDDTSPALSGSGSVRSGTERQLYELVNELRAMRAATDGQRALRVGSESLRALMRMLPRLRAMLATGVSHPFDLYLSLCDALGELGLVSATLDLAQLPLYSHDDPLTSFDALIDEIRRALSIFDLRYRVVPFTRRSDRGFELELGPGDLIAGASLLIGALSPRTRPRNAQRRWLDTATIGMAAHLEDIRRRRVAGWQRQVGLGADTLLGVVETPQMVLARIVPDREAPVRGGLLVVESDVGEGPIEMNFYRPIESTGAAATSRTTP